MTTEMKLNEQKQVEKITSEWTHNRQIQRVMAREWLGLLIRFRPSSGKAKTNLSHHQPNERQCNKELGLEVTHF